MHVQASKQMEMFGRDSYIFMNIRPDGAGSSASSVLVSTLPWYLLFDRPIREREVNNEILVFFRESEKQAFDGPVPKREQGR
jgi:hypothetical protein